MQESSFYRFCISACIFMILISLCMNFVILLGVFNTNTPSPILNQTTANVTKIAGGDFISIITDNFVSLLFAEGIGAVSIGVIILLFASKTGSWNVVAAYLFGAVFWISWGNSITFMLNIGNYFSSAAMMALYLILTVVMTFIFVGAILGLLGGTE